jgi:hypothetical protein
MRAWRGVTTQAGFCQNKACIGDAAVVMLVGSNGFLIFV